MLVPQRQQKFSTLGAGTGLLTRDNGLMNSSELNRAKARRKFFVDEGMPDGINFWLFYWRRLGDPTVRLSEDDLAELQAWVPDRSNCPELTVVFESLIKPLPDEWRTIADDLFVGRVLLGDVNATADTSKRARTIRIFLQYTTVLYAYVGAFDDLMQTLRQLLEDFKAHRPDVGERVAELDARLEGHWGLIEQNLVDWRDEWQVAGLSYELRALLATGRVQVTEDGVLAAERWVIAHELAHHLLGHTVSRQNQPARALIVSFLDVVDMTTLNPSQVQECQADILAFLLIARVFTPSDIPSGPDLYRAEMGAVLGLTSSTHVKDAWVTGSDPDETHPGFDVRFSIIVELTRRLCGDRPRGTMGDHPMDLLIDLGAFASVAFDAFRRRLGVGPGRRLDLLELMDKTIDEKIALGNQLRG